MTTQKLVWPPASRIMRDGDVWSVPLVLCGCGCGQFTRPDRQYRFGHIPNKSKGVHRQPWGSYPEPEWVDDCLCWRGPQLRGYGRVWGKAVHRVVWEMFNGPIPDGLTIDHVYDWGCRHTDCIRIAHMELVTGAENSRRTLMNRARRAITHCPVGHEYTEQNTLRRRRGDTGKYWGRACKKCKQLRTARRARDKRRQLREAQL